MKFIIWKIGQFPKIVVIVQFTKFTNFQNLTIWNIKKFF